MEESDELTVFEQLEQNNMTREEYLDILNDGVELGRKMKEITANPLFIELFEKKYIEEFALVNVQSIAAHKTESRERITEKMISRSHFSLFINQIITGGNTSVEALREFREAEKLESEDGQA